MPRWKELKRFCDRDGWELYKDTDHYFYRKIDDDGNIKLTKVSKGSGEIRSHMWREILKKQLHKNILTVKYDEELKAFGEGISRCFCKKCVLSGKDKN